MVTWPLLTKAKINCRTHLRLFNYLVRLGTFSSLRDSNFVVTQRSWVCTVNIHRIRCTKKMRCQL